MNYPIHLFLIVWWILYGCIAVRCTYCGVECKTAEQRDTIASSECRIVVAVQLTQGNSILEVGLDFLKDLFVVDELDESGRIDSLWERRSIPYEVFFSSGIVIWGFVSLEFVVGLSPNKLNFDKNQFLLSWSRGPSSHLFPWFPPQI